MLSTSRILLLQCQLLILENGIKEYSADWLENTNTVMRDAGGRFATKAKTSIEETKNSAKSLTKVVSEIRIDPTAAQHRVESEFLKKTSLLLDKAVEKNPGLVDKALSVMFGTDAQKSRDKLADIYGGINPGLPNAIKPDPLPTLVAEVKKNPAKAIVEGFEVAAHQYNKLIDDLNHVESDSEGIKLLGKLAATSIPIAGYLALTLTPEVAIGLMLEEGIGSILAGYAVGEGAAFGTAKVLDKAGIENPYVKFAAEMGAGIIASRGFTSAAKMFRSKGILPTKQIENMERIAIKEEEAAISEIADKADKIAPNSKNIPPEKIFKGKQRKLPKNVTKKSEIEDDIKWDSYSFLTDSFEFVQLKTTEIPIKLPFVNKSFTDVNFAVEGGFDEVELLPRKVKRQIALKLKGIFEHLIDNAEEGKIFKCIPYAKDGNDKSRIEAFTLFGFSKPQDGVMLGIMRNGKLTPYYPTFLQKYFL